MPAICTSVSTSQISTTFTASAFVTQPFVIAETNEDLIKLWLHGKSPNTQDGYGRDIRYFLAFVKNKMLSFVTLNDIYQVTMRMTGNDSYSDDCLNQEQLLKARSPTDAAI